MRRLLARLLAAALRLVLGPPVASFERGTVAGTSEAGGLRRVRTGPDAAGGAP